MKRLATTLALITATTSVTSAHADRSDWQLWTGIAALGVGAAAIGMTYYEASRVRAAQDDPDFDSYRRRFPSNTGDTCDEARAGREGNTGPGSPVLAPRAAEVCDDARSHETRQWVYFGGGLVLLTTGVVLLVTRPKPEERKPTVTLSPVIAPHASAMTLTVRF